MAKQAGLDEAGIDALRADLSDIRGRLAEVGVALGSNVGEPILNAAREFRSLNASMRMAMAVVVYCGRSGGPCLCRPHHHGTARAIWLFTVLVLLVSCLMIAVATTIGIIVSLVFESWHFFQSYLPKDFLFSTTWNPKFGGGSSLGIWPLLWGTLYVSFIIADRRGADRAAGRDLPVGICLAQGTRHREAAARGSGRHPLDRLRPFRPGSRGWPLAPRLDRRARRPGRLVLVGDDGGFGHGHHADPLCLVAVG